jgi:hypothetical protein
LPRLKRFASEDAERVAGCQMALDVEVIVDGGMNGQEALGWPGRLEPLHLVLASSHRLAPFEDRFSFEILSAKEV